jgi:hypothetical protein
MRRIKKADIKRLSLVKRGANFQPVLYKSDGQVELAALVKWDEEKGELLTLNYLPEYEDRQGHGAEAEVVRDFCWSFAKHGFALDLDHAKDPLPREKAWVAENFIVQKNDPRFQDWKDLAGKPVDATGGWATITKIEDPELRREYREGIRNGASLYGENAEFESETTDMTKTEELLGKILAKLDPKPDATEDALAKILAKLEGAAAPPPVEDQPDPTNLASMQKHLKKLDDEAARAELEELDLTDREAVRARVEELKKSQKRGASAQPTISKAASFERDQDARIAAFANPHAQNGKA